MRSLNLNKAFTLMESGPVVLVATSDGKNNNIMIISWTTVMDFTPRFAITTGEWNYSLTPMTGEVVKAPLIRECLANIECRVVDIVRKHSIVVLEAIAAHVASSRREKRTVHAVGDGTFIVDGRRLIRRTLMPSKLPAGIWRSRGAHA